MSRSRSSWHSMSRSPWHSMALQRRFPTSCSPVHVLTHVFSSVWFGCTQHHSLPSPPRAARVEGVVSRALVRRREHLVAGACASKVCTLRLSSDFALLGFPRSSALVLRVHVAIRVRLISLEYGCDRGLVSPASASGVDSRRSSVVATLRSCRRCGCVPRGQRALLDADMLELIDRVYMSGGACQCGVLCSFRACAVTRSKHVQRRVRSLLANVLSARPCGRSFAP